MAAEEADIREEDVLKEKDAFEELKKLPAKSLTETVNQFIEIVNQVKEDEKAEQATRPSIVNDTVRAMVIINPGNLTGQCLSVNNLQQILRFCHQESLFFLGDEVYQKNVYQDKRPFISSRHVLFDMGGAISKELEIISFHTVFKGFLGECGQRGGYFEMKKIPP
uniref:Aminotransferase class I/classII large domain-containing protein n=1 Tax=Lactuca sativa TaxID=4236 RepID=A0A9R1XLB0_LACSA|nr:hypothetical protein LSAT_V11C300126590 [Lactuca sativa]